MPRPLSRRSRGVAALLLAAAICLSGPYAPAAGPEEKFPQVVHIERSFDGKPFDCRIESRTPKDGYVVYWLTYPSPVVTPAVPQNNTIPAELFMPAGLKPGGPKRPAVISIHILDGNMELVRMTCSVLATHGIPAVLFKLPYYGERGLAEGPEAMARNPRLFVGAVSQAMQDVRRTVDVLAARPEIDPGRISITGVSLGAIVAATAAGSEPRLSRAMFILGGGDLLKVIHHARETRELNELINSLPPADKAAVEKAIQDVDPLRFADQLREKARQGKIRMVNAAQDEVIPRECTEELARALGMSDRVEWLDGLGHYTALAALPQILQSMVDFFAQDLPPGVKPSTPPAPRRTPVQMVITLGQQAIGFLTAPPREGRCHFADLAAVVTPKGQRPVEAQLRLICGAGGKFKLEAKAPVVGEVAIGQGTYPWLAATDAVFKGTKKGDGASPALVQGTTAKASDPLAFADPRHLTKLKVVAGGVAGAALAPDILDPLATITEEPAGKDVAIRIRPKKGEGTVTVQFKEDRKTPVAVDFSVRDVQGKVTFRVWQIDTVAAGDLFDPPARGRVQEVDPVELQRVFSAMFNFAMENLQ